MAYKVTRFKVIPTTYGVETPIVSEKKYELETEEEKQEAYGTLNDKQLKAYYEFRAEGFKHKTALDLAKDL